MTTSLKEHHSAIQLPLGKGEGWDIMKGLNLDHRQDEVKRWDSESL